MSKIITRIAAVGAAVSIGAGGLALTAPTADAATYKKVGTATVKEGRKVVREADQQRCLTVKETRKIVKGNGEYLGVEDGNANYYWKATGKAEFLLVQYHGGCANAAALVYDNGNVYSFLNGGLVWGTD